MKIKFQVSENDSKFKVKFFESYESDENKDQILDQSSESTKVVDYLNQIRMGCRTKRIQNKQSLTDKTYTKKNI